MGHGVKRGMIMEKQCVDCGITFRARVRNKHGYCTKCARKHRERKRRLEKRQKDPHNRISMDDTREYRFTLICKNCNSKFASSTRNKLGLCYPCRVIDTSARCHITRKQKLEEDAKIDLVGNRYSHWTVLEESFPIRSVKKTERMKKFWKCRCNCGSIGILESELLIKAKSTHCGCLSPQEVEKFDRLLVIEKGRKTRLICKCDCGIYIEASSHHLQQQWVKSCGCTLVGVKRPAGHGGFVHLYNEYKFGAQKRNKSFELTRDQCKELFMGCCYYCGDPPSKTVGRNQHEMFTYNGIDRVDNAQGYTLENSVTCCTRCNRAKMDSTLSDFFDLIRKVAITHKLV
jgi:hypothetical protein